MRIQPLQTRILVRKFEDDKIGNIYVPEQAKRASLRGYVEEVGEDCQYLEVGDLIIYGRYSGFELPLRDQKDLFVMNEEDVLCIIKED